jgi:hypothetical protein
MNVYGELIRAQLEVLSANPTPGVKGRVGYNETSRQAFLDTGTLIVPLGSGGGSALIWSLPDTNAPTPNNLNGVDLLDFDYLSTQEVYALFKVPSSYAAGNQIKLSGGKFAVSVTSNKVFFKTQSSLIKSGATVLDTYTNQRTSTNAEVTADSVASRITEIGDLDLTSTSGQINSVAVAADDLILIRLYRDTASESASAAADARLLRNSFEPRFS